LDNNSIGLGNITKEDVVREGFPDMDTGEFIVMFMKMHGENSRDWSTQPIQRIVFEYVEDKIKTYGAATRAAIKTAWARWPETRISDE